MDVETIRGIRNAVIGKLYAPAAEADILILLAEVDRLRSPWQPIATAPKDGSDIIAWRRGVGGYPIAVSWYDNEWRAWEDLSYDDSALSHWQPITPPPEKPK